ncbi:hypothetical protein [Parageobacillus sp. KH3-4]|nr:hypothetical protein [Parageobacillus sp. KH3-4]
MNQQQRIKELLKKEEVDRLKEFFASFWYYPLIVDSAKKGYTV